MRVPVRVRELALRLAREDALPGYVYDLGALDAHTARIRAALPPGVELYYAVKANPDPAVLRIVAGHADGLEVSSGGELRHVARVTPGRPLAFGGPGKSEAELAQAVRAAALLHVESPEELRLLAAVTRGRAVDVLLRANLAAPLRTEGELLMGGGPSPFGMDAAGLSQCAALLPGTELRLRGLHAHLASGLAVRAALDTAARVLRFARSWCARGGVRHPMITLGGGMAVDYRRPGTTFGWETYGRGLARQARPGEVLRIEPGRAVTAYCGWYVTRVLDLKRSHGAVFAVVAGGTHHLRTPAAKGHDQPFSVIPDEAWPHGWPRSGVAGERVTVTGQLCTPRDVLARQVRVRRLRTGDVIAFGMAGAYAWNISHTRFLMHPEPGFYYLGGAD